MLTFGKLYDPQKNCIVYVNRCATSDYWDEVWDAQGDWPTTITPNASKMSRPIRLVKKFTDVGEEVLEAGCGMGQYVYKLNKEGRRCTGVDNAAKTVSILNEYYPELDIRESNVFDLQGIKDNSYDCYYSGGVIEHFWSGYDGILDEAARVVRDDGNIILTFPFMSKARKRLGPKLPIIEGTEPEGFYQFALNPDEVEGRLAIKGFKLMHKKARNGLKGVLEVYPHMQVFRKLYNYSGRSKGLRGLKYIVSASLAKAGFGHTIEMVFRKSG